MTYLLLRRWLFTAIVAAVWPWTSAAPADAAPPPPVEVELAYAPAPVLQPLKGLVPYPGRAGQFPHSMEFGYLPLSALMTGPDRYDWTALEKLLSDVASRRCQTVFRVYLEYPGHRGIPRFFIDGGLKTHVYLNTNTQPFPPKNVETPDYENKQLRAAIVRFIHALGRRYDGDARVAYITAGILGTWGEWHTYPRNDLWASKDVQREVMDAYEASFPKTPVLLRYPAGPNDSAYAANDARRLGYHDDSFAFATLDTGRAADSWFFLPRLRGAGAGAAERWRTQPIGGEVRPEVWPTLWSEKGPAVGQDFAQCVRQTHATWLMDSSIARTLTPQENQRACAAARSLGYELHVVRVRCEMPADGRPGRVRVSMRNTGVAPFYHDWPVELGLLAADALAAKPLAAKPLATWPTGWKLREVVPGDPDRELVAPWPADHKPNGAVCLALRVVNPMPGGVALRFANATQDKHAPGWLTLLALPAPRGAAP